MLLQIVCGVNFKYNYFIKEETWPQGDIIWRSGPEYSLLVPFKQGRDVVVRDSWMRFNNKTSPVHLWESWIEEMYLPVKPSVSAPTRGNISILANLYLKLHQLICF